MTTPKRKRGVPDSYSYSYYEYTNENPEKQIDMKKKAQTNFENKSTKIFVDRFNQRFEEQKEAENQGNRVDPAEKIFAKINSN